MMLVDHTQASQGFSGGLSVGIWEAKASGGDEPGVHIRVAGAFSHEDHLFAPKSAPGVVHRQGSGWRCRAHISASWREERRGERG